MTTLATDGPAPSSAALVRSATRRSGARCVGLALVTTAVAGANLLLPAALGRALDLLLAGSADTGRWVLWCVLLMLLLTVLDAAETVLGGTTSAETTAWLRRRLVDHVLAVGPRAVGRFGSGDLVARLTGNAAQAGTAPTAIAGLIAAVTAPVGAVVALALISPWTAAVFIVGAPVLVLLLRAFTRDSSECVARYQRVQGRIADALSEAIGGHRTITAASAEERTAARVLRPLPELSREGHRMWRVQGKASAQAVAVAPLLQLGVLAVAGVLLGGHRLSVGEFLAASRYAVLAAGVGVLVGQVAELVRARAAAARLEEVLAQPPTEYGARRLPDGQGGLELRGVTVRRGGRTVLDGVDLVVPAGSTLAVVGRSGTGKSLLAAVAGRLTDPDEGEVRLDGVPVRELDREELRRAVSHAFERPALLGGSIEDTIAFGVPTPAAARVREAARAARADPFVRRLPEGYATPCVDAPLSGGEVQRLGLARAFAHPGRLIVLDDALSSLDTVTERQVSEALLRHTLGSTRLIVAHRASTAARADMVAWLDGGKVRAVGPHARLWRMADYRRAFGAAGAGPTLDPARDGAGPAQDGADDDRPA